MPSVLLRHHQAHKETQEYKQTKEPYRRLTTQISLSLSFPLIRSAYLTLMPISCSEHINHSLALLAPFIAADDIVKKKKKKRNI